MATLVLDGYSSAFLRGLFTLAAGETSQEIQVNGSRGLCSSIQVEGTLNSSITVQVSNNLTNWYTAKDLTGTAMVLLVASFTEFATGALYIRLVAGAGTGSATVTLVMKP
jgi:hypothetical protein